MIEEVHGVLEPINGQPLQTEWFSFGFTHSQQFRKLVENLYQKNDLRPKTGSQSLSEFYPSRYFATTIKTHIVFDRIKLIRLISEKTKNVRLTGMTYIVEDSDKRFDDTEKEPFYTQNDSFKTSQVADYRRKDTRVQILRRDGSMQLSTEQKDAI